MILFLIILAIFFFIIFIISVSSNQPVNKNSSQIKKTSDNLNFDNKKSNYEYNANTWDTRTPLEVLNNHGKILRNVRKSQLPNFGDKNQKHGIWLEFLDNTSLTKPSNKEIRELDFLKKFRKFYENDMSHQKKHEAISSLLIEYKDIELHKSIFKWYLWELCEVPGISHSISEIMYTKDIKNIQDLKNASDKELIKISGLGQSRLKQIKDYFKANGSDKKKIEPVNSSSKKQIYSQIERSISTKKIEINNSLVIKIFLPNLKYEKNTSVIESEQDWTEYNKITEKAKLLYKTDKYRNSVKEWLKIYDWYHKDEKYFTHLMRSYRKYITNLINENEYEDALLAFNDFFNKCPDFTNSDIQKYNKLIRELNTINPDENLNIKEPVNTEEVNYKIVSDSITFIQDMVREKKTKFNYKGTYSILDLIEKSNYAPISLPHIEFDEEKIICRDVNTIPCISTSTYRFKDASSLNVFLSSSKELMIYLYKWNGELINSFDASKYSESHTHLRQIELAANLSCFIFTVIDKAYILDSKMNFLNCLQVPYKDGYEKIELENANEPNILIKEYLNLLNLSENPKPSKDEIKKEFRKLIIEWHPDKNPDNPLAEEKTKQLIQAYEYLSGEDAQSAFDNIDKTDYFWVDISSFKTYDIGEGTKVNIGLTIGTGEDWIYGTGMSVDGSRIYLGCYSGIVYQLNSLGKVEKIYIAPPDKYVYYGNVYARTNPINYITEYNNRLYILSEWYLYILEDDKIINSIKFDEGNFKWFKNGLFHIKNKELTVYNTDGMQIGLLSFKSSIKLVSYTNSILLVETKDKSYTFKIN